MSKLGSVTFKGKSGTEYEFDVYKLNTLFKDDYAAVYCITKREQNKPGSHSHTMIYVGETGELGNRLDNHHKQRCFEQHNANCVCVLGEPNEQTRLKIEADLIANYDPDCND